MIVLASSTDRAWPWADLGERAEAEFKARYPSVVWSLEASGGAICGNDRTKAKYWWELRPCAYWDAFEKEKLSTR